MLASCGRTHALGPFATTTAMTLAVCQTLRLLCVDAPSVALGGRLRSRLGSSITCHVELRSYYPPCC